MKLSISIHYKTSTDQAPLLNIVNNDKEITIPMNSMPCDLWRAETEIETTPNHQLDYYYSVGDRQESQINSITLEPQYEWYVIEDHWHDPLEYPSLSSSPFVNIFNKAKKKNQKGNLCFEIKYPTPTSPEQKIVMVGNCPELGDWNPKKAPQFQQIGSERWQLKIPYQELPSTIEYKYVILSPQTTQWEEGENRKRELNGASPQTYYIYSREAAPRIKPSPWQGAGVAIPLFSLRSENSAGIGDFADLEKFAQWTASIGAKVVQILPINDTTQTHTHQDSYPYSAISVYALHPLYLSLDRMGILQDATLAHQIADRAQQLNNLELLDYDKVDTLKWEFFRALYRQDGARTLESKEYQRFYNQNQKWLKPYALFSFLRDINGTADYSQWGEWKEYDPQKADRLVSPQGGEYQEIAIYLYLQYHLDKQLREVRQACAQMGVALKGDIPIGVNRHSVESWIEPHLFNLNAQAGAPPDAFSSQGQNWGLPTYNWKQMAKDGYRWWRNRFAKMYDYFELYRIDHILGFFRIWEIPEDSIDGTLGHFSPALPLTSEELTERGLTLKEHYKTPTLTKAEINRLFNKDRAQIFEEFFDPIEGRNNLYRLKSQFLGQRQIREHLQQTKREEIEPQLFQVAQERLFVGEEREGEMLFHPRISAQETQTYKRLPAKEKEAFDRIYEDFFYHRHNQFWAESAKEKLPPLIGATPMLTCAEDLGMIPDCVAETLDQLKIITLELERMPKESYRLFGDPSQYPYLSVCTTSTHDMSPIRLWWRELTQEQQQQYYHQVMNRPTESEAPQEQTIEISRDIVQRHLDSSSILAILPLQDLFATDSLMREGPIEQQRINIPSDPNHYWRYRMHLTIEALIAHKAFAQRLRKMIRNKR